jgi:DNA polymerase III subunit beta
MTESKNTKSDAEYNAAFPNGPQPIATFPNTPEGMAAAKEVIGAAAVIKAFSPGGGGVEEIAANARKAGYAGNGPVAAATINRVALLAAMATACRVAEKRTAIPMLATVLIKGDMKSGITIRASDLDLECEVLIRHSAVLAPFEFCVSAGTLLDVCRKAKAPEVTISVMDDQRTRFSFGALNVNLDALLADDFPIMVRPPLLTQFQIDSPPFLAALNRCIGSITTEGTRYYLNGIFFQSIDGQLRLTSTDGHRLAQQRMPLPSGAEEMPAIIIPRVTIVELIKMLSSKGSPETVDMEILKKGGDIRVAFKLGDTNYLTKRIDGTYPDYERVIPKDNKKTLTLDRLAAIEAIDCVSIMTVDNQTPRLKLSMNSNTMFSVSNPDKGTTTMTIEGQLLEEGEDGVERPAQMDIAFNATKLRDILNCFRSDYVTLRMGSPASPVLFTGKDDAAALHIQMPMKI